MQIKLYSRISERKKLESLKLERKMCESGRRRERKADGGWK